MTVFEILQALHNKNIKLSVSADKLKIDAPKGSLNAELVAELKKNKLQLIEYITASTYKAVNIKPIDRSQQIPLSFAQQRLWFIDQVDGGSSQYNTPGVIDVSGKFNIEIAQAAFSKIIQRHEPLRTNFKETKKGALQIIHDKFKFEIIQVDLSQQSTDRQHELVTTAIKQDIELPFNLNEDLMLRVSYFTLNKNQGVMLFNMHHIASDGWSISILVNEFLSFYHSESTGTKNTLAPLEIQYADYAHWQRQWLEGDILERQLSYWSQQLAGLPQVHSLPLDFERPKYQTFNGGQYSFSLNLSTLKQLTSIAVTQQATLFMVLHAAFSIVLSRYSNSTDIVIATPVANRMHKELESLIGFFVNTLVLRSDCSENSTFTDFLNKIKHINFAAQNNQDVPFEFLVDKINPIRSNSFNALFQVMLSMENNEQFKLELPDVTLIPRNNNQVKTKFELELNAVPIYTESEEGLQAGLHCFVEYNTDLFKPQTIIRLAESMQLILASIATNPSQLLADLPLLNQKETDYLRHVINDRPFAQPSKLCLHQLFELQVEKTPNDPALVFNQQHTSYLVLNEKANQVAHYLIAQGVKKDDLVGICLTRSTSMMVAILAVLKAGAAYLPLDPSYPKGRLDHMMQDGGLSLVITQNSLLKKTHTPLVKQLSLDHISWLEQLSSYSVENPVVVGLTATNLAYVIYTSGSTGKPKGVMIEHNSVTNHILNVIQQLGFSDEERFLQFSSMSFDTFLEQTFASLTLGTRLYLRDETLWSAEEFYQHCHANQITVTDLAPVYLSELLNNKLAREFWSTTSLTKVVVGGETLHRSVIEKWTDLTGKTICQLFNAYGPTETTITSHIKCVAKDKTKNPTAVSIGRVLSGRNAYILDQHQNLSPNQSIGELYIGGMGLARGYLNQAELTDEKFIEHTFSDGQTERLYRTGDLVRYLSDSCGEIEFIDRIDDQIKLRGFRVELGEIEYRMTQQDDIISCVVMVREDVPGQKRIVGYYVSDSTEDEDALSSTIKANLVNDLPTYMVPSFLVRIKEIPLNVNGKVDRKALPLPSTESSPVSSHQAANNETEHKLCQIWADLLTIPIEKLSTNDNFFSLGGDSILSIQVASRAMAVGLKVTIKQIFEFQTIATLAPHVVSSQINAFQGAVLGAMPLLPIQHNFFSDRTELHHYNQSIILNAPNELTPQLMKHFIQHLFIKHDALRLRFVEENDHWIGSYEAYTAEMLTNSLAIMTLRETGFTSLEKQLNTFQTSLSLASGSLFKAIHCTDANGEIRLIMIMHHLIVDGVSWRIIFADLEQLYQQFCAGKTLALNAKTTSYKAWGEFLLKYSQDKSLQAELSYWQNVLATPSLNHMTITAENLTQNDQHIVSTNKQFIDFGQIEFNLTSHQTSQLLTVAQQAYRTQINELLLSSLLLGIYNWSGDQRVRIDLEGHGREELSPDLNLSQTVGWFTTIFPLILNSDLMDIKSVICAVKEQSRGVPNHGIGFGVLKYLTKAEGIADSDNASILFNYLGQFSNRISNNNSFSFTNESTGENISPMRRPEHGLNLNVAVIDGEMSFVLDYDQSLYQRTSIESFLKHLNNALNEVIHHCVNPINGSLTPADFPLSKISSKQLNIWQKQYLIEDIYPATAMQKGLIFHSTLDKSAYLTQLMFTLEAGVNMASFRLAWQKLLDRHGILRTLFVNNESGEMQQIVIKSVQMPWSETNLVSLDKANQLQQIESDREFDKAAGFDLDQGPLLRIKVWHLGQDRYRVLLSDHHALTDGWSMPLIFAEVMQFYRAEVTGIESKIEAAVPFRNYVQWLNEQNTKEAIHFWQQELSGLEHPSLMAKSMPNYEHDETSIICELSLNHTDSDQLVAQARELKVTINSLLHAAWAYLLSRYCDQSTVVFATTVSGRPEHLTGVEKMIGLFINTIPVRIDIPQNQRFDDWVKSLHAKQIERNHYSYLPLVEIQQLAELNVSNLMDHLFVFENYPFDDQVNNAAEDLSLQASNHKIYEETNYNLAITATLEETIKASFVAKSSHFNEQALSRLVKHFKTILCSIAEKPEQLVEDIKLLTDRESHYLLHELNSTQTDYPQDSCVHQLFEQQVESTPNSVALVYQEHSLSYAALNAKANQLAHHLIAQGVKPDDLVGLCVERSLDMMIGLLAILKAGGAYLPLDPTYPKARLNHMLHDSAISVIVTQSDLAEITLGVIATQVIVDDAACQTQLGLLSNKNPDIELLTAQHLAYLIYTSGSTGNPKGVMLEHQGLINLAVAHINHISVNSESRVLQFASINFDAATWEWMMALLTGATLYICPHSVRYDAEALANYLQQHLITHTLLPPAVLQHLDVNQPFSFQALVVGGEAFDQQLSDLWGAKYAFYNAYGPSEVTVCATISSTIQAGELNMGKAINNTRLYILDQRKQLVPHGSVGELYLAGAGLARGYLNQPQLTEHQFISHTFSDGTKERLYRTGDLVKYTEQHDLVFVGRTDHQIKIRGFRVELTEIEQLLSLHVAVNKALVVVDNQNIDQQVGDKRLVAYVATGSEYSTDLTHELRSYIKQHLPDYMVPAVLIQVEKFPLNANGKIDRKLLPLPEIIDQNEVYVLPSGRSEVQLSEIWAELLKIPVAQISSQANFFELGGHSLLVTTLLHRMTEKLSVQLNIKNIYQSPTIKEIAVLVDSLTPAYIQTLQRQDNTKPMPLSYGQYRIWFTEQIKKTSNEHNMAVAVAITGEFSSEVFEQALNSLIKQHDILRTKIKLIDNQPMQIIEPVFHCQIVVTDLTHLPQHIKDETVSTLTHKQDTQIFNLSKLPLFSVLLLKVESNEYILHFNQHHIISDGWSQQLFYSQLMAAYQQIEQQQHTKITELPFNYADYAVWQQQWLESGEAQQQKQFWKSYLKGSKEQLQLPNQKPKGTLDGKQNMVETFIDSITQNQLKSMAHKHKGSMFNLLQSAFAVLIARITGESDFNIGIPVTGRHIYGTQNMLGMFLNTLPLRHKINLTSTFNDVLTGEVQNVERILSNQDLPLEQIFELAECERNPESTPMFQILFNMLSLPESTINESNLKFTMEMHKTAEIENKFNLTLYLKDSVQGIKVYCNYNSSKFSPHAIRVMLDQYTTLLQQIAVDANKPCLDYSLNLGLASIDYDKPLTGDRQDTLLEVTMKFRQWAKVQPSSLAIKDEFQDWTYQELLSSSYELALELRSMGVKKGDVVTIMAARQANMVVAILAILQLGAAYSVVTPETPVSRIIQHLDIVKNPVILMCESESDYPVDLIKTIKELTTILYVANHPIQCKSHTDSFIPEVNLLESVACITFTSGSSGVPKAVEGTHQGLCGYLTWLPAAVGINQSDCFGMLSGLAHDPLQRDIFGALCNGATLTIPSKQQFQSYQFSSWIKKQQISVLHITPAMGEIISMSPDVDLQSLKVVFITGETLRRETAEALFALNPGMHILNCYGATETQRSSTYYKFDSHNDFDVVVPISMSTEDTRLRLINDHGINCGLGEVGLICIESARIAKGYLNDHALTAQRFTHFSDHIRRYNTGDLGVCLDGKSIKYLGRKDAQINIRGFRVELGEVEYHIRQHSKIKSCAVIIHNAEQIIAYVTTYQPTPEQSLVVDLTAHLAAHLLEYMRPSAIILIDKIPLTENNKVDYRSLPDPSDLMLNKEYIAPCGSTEVKLAQIWAKLLKLSPQDISSKVGFFELGGHSLLLLKLLSEIRLEFSLEINLKFLFECQNLSVLAELIDSMSEQDNLNKSLAQATAEEIDEVEL